MPTLRTEIESMEKKRKNEAKKTRVVKDFEGNFTKIVETERKVRSTLLLN